MKKIVSYTLLSLMAFTCIAQEAKTEDQIIEDLFKTDKLSIVKRIVNPKTEELESFMKIYNAYEVERIALSKEEFDFLNFYASSSSTILEAGVDSLMQISLDLSSKREELIRAYYAKMKEGTNGKLATQFYQAERYLWITIMKNIYDANYFIGEGEEIHIDEKKAKKEKKKEEKEKKKDE